MEQMLERLLAKMDATQAMLTKMNTKMKAWQEASEVYPEKMEPNSGEKETVVKWQEIPNEEAAIHSSRACRKEMMAC
jgi:hypothetical protein